MKRRKLPPDKRLDWRDPDMPVLKQQLNGSYAEVEPDYAQKYYAQKIDSPFYGAPSYKDDPTYNLKKRKNKY